MRPVRFFCHLSFVIVHYTKRLDHRRAGVGPDTGRVGKQVEELEALILSQPIRTAGDQLGGDLLYRIFDPRLRT